MAAAFLRTSRHASRMLASGNVTMTFQSSPMPRVSVTRPSLRGSTCRTALDRVRRADKESDHLGIAHLVEIAIVEADCTEPDRRLQADGLVGVLAQGRERIRRRYRYGENQPRGITASHGLQCHPHRRASGDPVIDNDCCTPGDVQCWTTLTVRFSAPLDLFELTCCLFPDVALGDIQAGRQIPVDKSFRKGAVSDRTESELGLPGHPDLAHEHDIERCVERLGNLETDRDTAARQCEDDRLLVFQMQKLVSEPVAGVAAICVSHDPTSPKWAENQSLACSTTASSVPGSSKRCVAPGTTTSFFAQRSSTSAARLSASTSTSSPPTISNVGALTEPSAEPARSGRPPRETIAATGSSAAAAARSAAAAPVLAPKYPTGRLAVSASSLAQAAAIDKRCASSPTSKTLRRWRASLSVRRSNTNVARPASRSACATKLLRGLNRPLPLPCANSTIPLAIAAKPSRPSSPTGGMEMARICSRGALSATALSPPTSPRKHFRPTRGRRLALDQSPPAAAVVSSLASG